LFFCSLQELPRIGSENGPGLRISKELKRKLGDRRRQGGTSPMPRQSSRLRETPKNPPADITVTEALDDSATSDPTMYEGLWAKTGAGTGVVFNPRVCARPPTHLRVCFVFCRRCRNIDPREYGFEPTTNLAPLICVEWARRVNPF
jgi:hypothetical protein